MNALKSIVRPALLISIGVLWSHHAHGAITGQWDFASGNLAATVGRNLDYFDGPGGATADQTLFGTTTQLGIADIGGSPAPVMGFPKSTSSMGYVMYPEIEPNGGGSWANQYSIVMDILFPASSANQWRALLQIEDTLNFTGADVFVNPSNAVGADNQFHGQLQADQWHRLVLTVDLAAAGGPMMAVYIDGAKAGEHILSQGVDGRWALNPKGGAFGDDVLLFTEGNPSDGSRVQPGYVSSIQVHDVVLSAGYVLALGGPSADGIPSDVSVPATVQSISPAPGERMVLPNVPVEVVIAEGDTAIDEQTVQLTFDEAGVTATIERPSPGVVVVRYQPPQLAPLSEHSVRVVFFDPVAGEPVDTGVWTFRMAPYHLAGTPVPGAVFSMSMDESPVVEGTRVMDASGNDNHGTFRSLSGSDRSVPGAIGNAILFGRDGENYIQLDHPWAGTPNTFSAWVQVASDAIDGRIGVIAGNWNNANNINWEMHTFGRPRVFWNGGNPDWNISGIDFRSGEWEHFVFVRDPGLNRFTFYRNGSVAAVRDGDTGVDVVPQSASFIGADTRPGTLGFLGAIDEVNIFDRPLDEDEVWRLYGQALELPGWQWDTPPIVSVAPEEGALDVARFAVIEVVIDENFSQTQLNPASIELRLNGSLVTPTIDADAGTFTVRYEVPSPLLANALNTAEIRYNDNGSPSTQTVKEWSFTTAAGPSIVAGPQDKRVFAGQTAVFSVTAEVTPPVTYQWRRNGVDIDAPNSALLVLRNVQLADAGDYTVLVTDAGGSEESAPAMLAVIPRPLPSLVALEGGPLPGPAPAFHMPMDEASATAFAQISDMSPNGNHGTFHTESEVSRTVPGAIGNAIQFGPAADGSNYIELGQAWLGTPNTFSAWIRVSPEVPDGQRVGVMAGNFDDANAINWELHTSGRPRAYWNNAPSWIIDGIDLRTGEWEQVTFVRDAAANRFRFYWNGVEAATLSNPGANIVPGTKSNIGADNRGPGSLGFRGAIDEIVIYSQALSPEEVRQLHSRQIDLDGSSFPTPQVWTVTPAPDETGVALEPVIQAVVNDSFSQTDVNIGTLQLFLNDSPVSGASIQSEGGFHTITYVPPTPLLMGVQYTAEVRFQDSAGASISQSWQFTTAFGPPQIIIPPRTQTAREGTDLLLWVDAQVSPPADFQWFHDSTLLSGATGSTLELRDVTVADSGTYSVQISDAGGTAEASGTLTVVASLPSDPAASVEIGLTAHWPFDDDFSSPVSGFDAVPFNDPVIASPGRVGAGAAQFVRAAGTHLRVNRPVLVDETLEYTISGWFNLGEDGAGQRRALWETAPTSWPISAEINTGGNIAYFIRDAELASRSFNTSIPAVVGQWHHILVVFDGREGYSTIYVDGEPVFAAGQDASIVAHPAGVGTAPVSAFHMGTFRDPAAANPRMFDGLIDEVAIWNRVLTSNEIAWLAAGNPIGSFEPGLHFSQAELEGSGIRLTWEGGNPPFQIHFRPSLTDGDWTVLGEVSENTFLAPLTGQAGFFQVTGN